MKLKAEKEDRRYATSTFHSVSTEKRCQDTCSFVVINPAFCNRVSRPWSTCIR